MAVFNLPILILSDRTPTTITGTTVGTTIAIDENIATGSLVATMTHDGTAASFAIASGNTNGDFAIANNGDITVVNSPDYETTSSYSLGITATDAIGNTSAPFTVTININDLDEIAPVVTLVSQTYNAVFETDNNLTIASFTATDAGNDVTNSLTLSGTPNTTNFALSYNSSTQQMDLVTASSGLLGGGVTTAQTFTLTASATDAAGNTGSDQVIFVVNNAEAPTITSGSASLSVVENTSTSTVLSTYTATGTTPISFSVTGSNAANFDINSSGELTFANSPDYETVADRSQSINVVATNQFGAASQAVAVTVTDDPSDVATAIDAYIAANYSGETIHTRTSTDPVNPDGTGYAHVAAHGNVGPYQWSKLYDASRSVDPGFWDTTPTWGYYGFIRSSKNVANGIKMEALATHGIHSGHWSAIKTYVDAGNAQDAIFWARWQPYSNTSHSRGYSPGTYNGYNNSYSGSIGIARETWTELVIYYHPTNNSVYQVSLPTGTVTDITSAVGI